MNRVGYAILVRILVRRPVLETAKWINTGKGAFGEYAAYKLRVGTSFIFSSFIFEKFAAVVK